MDDEVGTDGRGSVSLGELPRSQLGIDANEAPGYLADRVD